MSGTATTAKQVHSGFSQRQLQAVLRPCAHRLISQDLNKYPGALMIAGIGVDLATISRVAKVHERFGDRFAKRILNDAEWQSYCDHADRSRMLTKRFAVKEAAVKALGTGEREGVLLRDFYVIHDELGKPSLNVSGKAALLCQQRGINRFWVSLSDEGNTVTAFVILETSN